MRGNHFIVYAELEKSLTVLVCLSLVEENLFNQVEIFLTQVAFELVSSGSKSV